ncbi:alpha-N-arabinofuranosidase [Sphingomonas spermidinifaciens]|uniref:Alpha-N-arabinofuranosidase n=1 Tax=Sphingomonas spermidinifaciens TaxID=1141889 RepID=A0A2A4B0V8_9SPHN|nr:glycoside hydrolase family 43 protein [Sphingomonas spermidinifaciens]PCD02813.1 alpha-N-arabinofuranosidase [Sphingomonas spermidinifaciens]
MRATLSLAASALALSLAACSGGETQAGNDTAAAENASAGEVPLTNASADAVGPDGRKYLSQPLTTEIYTADPSAHVWGDGKLYVYGSHDIDGDAQEDDLGGHFEMRDYRILELAEPGGKTIVHPVALDVKDVPWADKQMWAPDAAFKNGTYYLYFPAKDKQGAFRIGVATSQSPVGPFKAAPQPIKGSFSIDPSVFADGGEHYIIFGGIWGGQLQRNTTGTYDPNGSKTDLEKPNEPALSPKIAKLSGDMMEFAEKPRDIQILDEAGKPLLGGDTNRRFFEAAWMHKRGDTYYLSYSTGDTHYLVYATGKSPYGPFTYRGRILEPVNGWTSHHSIVDWKGKSWLFYHDVQLSGQTRLRNVKMTELKYNPDGSIQTIDPFVK